MANSKVSIIIPAYNERKVIRRLLESIKKQTVREVETIVVDDSSTDDTANRAKGYTNLVFTRKHAERSVQRNYGAAKAKGEYLLFLDADMELSPGVVQECIAEAKRDNKVGAVAIPEKPVASNFWGRVKAFERTFYNESGDVATDAARFFSKTAFEKVGGYDETITGPEDWDLPEGMKKKGYKIGRVKAVIYHHERVPNPFKLAQKKYYYGLKSHRYFRKQKISTFGPKTIYFLRPVFYKKWKKLVANPAMTLAMFFMLTLEQIGGGFGYLVGKIRNS